MATGQLVSRSLRDALRNPQLLVILVLEFLLLSALGILFFILLLAIIMRSNPAAAIATSLEEFLSIIMNPATIAIVSAIVLIEAFILALIDAFFKAGFFGMVRNTIQDGSTTLREFLPSAKRYFAPIFWVQLIGYGIVLISLIPTLLVGLSILGTSPQFVPETQWFALAAWFVFALLVWLVLFVLLLFAEPAIVFDGERALESIQSSIRLIAANKARTLILVLCALAILILASSIEWLLGFPLALLAKNNPQAWQMASDLWGLVLNLISLYGTVAITILIFLFYAEITGKRKSTTAAKSLAARRGPVPPPRSARKAPRSQARSG